MNYSNVAVLIPCYNEHSTIKNVIHDFMNNLPGCKVYVYDNNSTDDTAMIARDNNAIVCYEVNQGKGNVVRRMFREVDADCYILVDGDSTYPADIAPEMVRYIFELHCDMVVGDRLSSTYFSENTKKSHDFGNVLVRFLVNHWFQCNIKDIMTGYRAFSRNFVKNFHAESCGFEIETEMTIWAVNNNMSIGNIVVDYKDRPCDSFSKINTFSDGVKIIFTIIRMFLLYRPFMFFSIISLILLVIGLLSDYHIIFILISVFCLFTGIVLHFLNFHFKFMKERMYGK